MINGLSHILEGLTSMNPTSRMLIQSALMHIKDFIYNLLYFAEHSPTDQELAQLRNLVLSLPSKSRLKYNEECNFIESLGPAELHKMFIPYGANHNCDMSRGGVVGYSQGLAYVEHGNSSKKVFFPRYMKPVDVAFAYSVLVGIEGILGAAISPHSYQDSAHMVECNDVILDIGCAEALFALDNIEKASKVYLFESLKDWRKPLLLTFAPYKGKTVLVNKLVADKTTRKTTTIADVVQECGSPDSKFFVKMDIEGCERDVIKGNADFFRNNKVKLSCCCYHRQDDAVVIEKLLKDMGYSTRFSEGYMLTPMNGIHYPYFRRGVIYAQNF